MNTRTCLRRPSSRTLILTACLALSPVAPRVTYADPPAAQTPHILKSSVPLSDLDLSTPEGVRAAHKRLRGKAEYLCRQLWDNTSATYRWSYATCVKKTFADAIRGIDGPALAVADRSREEP
jgi:UrcA family protein